MSASERLPGHHAMPLRLARKRQTFDQAKADIDAGQAKRLLRFLVPVLGLVTVPRHSTALAMPFSIRASSSSVISENISPLFF